MSQARLAMMTANINRGENTPPFEDIAVFLPFPAQYIIDNTDILVSVPKKVAKEFLDSVSKLPAEVEVAFTKWMPGLQAMLLK